MQSDTMVKIFLSVSRLGAISFAVLVADRLIVLAEAASLSALYHFCMSHAIPSSVYLRHLAYVNGLAHVPASSC